MIGLCFASQSAIAAPVTLGPEAYRALADAIGTSHSSAVAVADEPAEAASPPIVQAGMLPAGSMSGNPSSLITAGVGVATALSNDAPVYEPDLIRLYLLSEDSVFIPPRFLDGIFRPPRAIVSL